VITSPTTLADVGAVLALTDDRDRGCSPYEELVTIL